MASSHTRLAARLQAILAMADSSGGGVPCRPGQHQGPLQQQARPFELDGHVGDLPLQALELRQRLACPDLAVAHVGAWRTRARPGRRPGTSPRCRSARG